MHQIKMVQIFKADIPRAVPPLLPGFWLCLLPLQPCVPPLLRPTSALPLRPAPRNACVMQTAWPQQRHPSHDHLSLGGGRGGCSNMVVSGGQTSFGHINILGGTWGGRCVYVWCIPRALEEGFQTCVVVRRRWLPKRLFRVQSGAARYVWLIDYPPSVGLPFVRGLSGCWCFS